MTQIIRLHCPPLHVARKCAAALLSGSVSRLSRFTAHSTRPLPLVLVAAILIPVLLFAIVVSLLLDRKDRVAIEQQLELAARSASAAVNLKLADQLATLETIAAAIDIAEVVDGAGLREARRVLDAEPNWLGLSLVEPASGRRIVQLGRGTKILSSSESQTQIGHVSPPDDADTAQYVPLQVPVRRDGRIVYLLTAHVRTTTFADVLNGQAYPTGWAAGIFDDKYQPISRALADGNQAYDRSDLRSVVQLFAAHTGEMVRYAHIGEMPRYFSFNTARFSGWTTFVGAPADVIEAPLRRHRMLMLGAGAMSVLLTLFLAATLWRSAARLREESALVSQKDVLLREINHRIKNNLQVISSLINLQAQYVTLPEVRRHLVIADSRVRALSLVHEQLHPRLMEGLIDLSVYLDHLSSNLFAVHDWRARSIKLVRDLRAVTVKADVAVPIGLIANEAVTNSLKHAFPHDRGGTVRIALEPSGAYGAHLEITDDGIGLGRERPQDQGVGLSLIEMLADQTGGEIRWQSSRGTSLHLEFPVDAGVCVGRAFSR